VTRCCRRSFRLKVVGIASFPAIGAIHAAHTSLGTGALVAPEVVPGYDLDITGGRRGDFGPRTIFVRYLDGTDAAKERAHLQRTTAPLSGFAGLDVVPVQRPVEISNTRSVRGLPIALASALALAALASLALALAGATSRHRLDLAVLRAFGCTGRQLAATMSWLATATMVVGVAIGLPLGIIVGRLSWGLFAQQLDVVHQPAVPVALVVEAALAALLLANVGAVLPARRARHVETAQALRAP
jgi:predicted lysophospholipase L1 biosynthesis ABC-type transport system permease subunit